MILMAQIERRRIDTLVADPSNTRRHDPRNLDAIRASLRSFGQQKPIVVDGNGVVIAGNGTLAAAQAEGWGEIDVVVSDLDGASKTAYAIADNRTAELAAWDDDALAQTLAALQADPSIDELVTGFDEAEIARLLDGLGTGGEAAEDAAPALLPEPVGRVGDLWLLGRHRVLCGDATASDDVKHLLAGAVPGLCVTDPPYGVNYDPAWRNVEAAKGNLAYAAIRVGPVTNDDRADWREAWFLFPGQVLYSWHPAGATSLIHAAAIEASGFVLRMQIIWAKSNFPIGRGDYHVRHEPCWYAVRDGKPAKRTDDRTQTTLWEINLDRNVEGGHSTQKPLECMARPIRNHEFAEVYDPFLGSGTTLIAAEQLRRTCYGIEIEPRYVDVTIRRWMAATGESAVRESDGAKWTELADGAQP